MTDPLGPEYDPDDNLDDPVEDDPEDLDEKPPADAEPGDGMGIDTDVSDAPTSLTGDE